MRYALLMLGIALFASQPAHAQAPQSPEAPELPTLVLVCGLDGDSDNASCKFRMAGIIGMTPDVAESICREFMQHVPEGVSMYTPTLELEDINVVPVMPSHNTVTIRCRDIVRASQEEGARESSDIST
jgi:hypothetical protein